MTVLVAHAWMALPVLIRSMDTSALVLLDSLERTVTSVSSMTSPMSQSLLYNYKAKHYLICYSLQVKLRNYPYSQRFNFKLFFMYIAQFMPNSFVLEHPLPHFTYDLTNFWTRLVTYLLKSIIGLAIIPSMLRIIKRVCGRLHAVADNQLSYCAHTCSYW